MKKRILIYCALLPFLLAGCVKHQNIKFNSTNSMCLDATIANLQAARCRTVLVTKPLDGITKISCFKWDKKAKDSMWINHEFYAIELGRKMPKDTNPMCKDKHMIMISSERDQKF
jgi:uncharacterized protein YcfL